MDDADQAIERATPSDDLEADDGISDAPLVRLVNSIIFQAAEDGASDVHFEPQEDALVVRYRIDGVLHVAAADPDAARLRRDHAPEGAREARHRRAAQAAGRPHLAQRGAAGRLLDIRVATLPTVEGESVVDAPARQVARGADARGARPLGRDARRSSRAIIAKPTGALLVTGPTGSGKSTTLYAALAETNRPEINVITVEDPVEYRLAGINQVQINPRAGLTFATALRSILRSDPDVVMVGEIRDGETANISIEAALTGHFVLSTLHTNDAPGAITRLNEMGVEPFLTGAAVSAVLAQRLARKLCPHCCGAVRADGGRADRGARRARVAAALDGVDASTARWAAPAAPDRLQGPDRHLPVPRDERRAREPRRAKAQPRRDRARRAARRACARSGTTASTRSSPGSPRSKSSPASCRRRATLVS